MLGEPEGPHPAPNPHGGYHSAERGVNAHALPARCASEMTQCVIGRGSFARSLPIGPGRAPKTGLLADPIARYLPPAGSEGIGSGVRTGRTPEGIKG